LRWGLAAVISWPLHDPRARGGRARPVRERSTGASPVVMVGSRAARSALSASRWREAGELQRPLRGDLLMAAGAAALRWGLAAVTSWPLHDPRARGGRG